MGAGSRRGAHESAQYACPHICCRLSRRLLISSWFRLPFLVQADAWVADNMDDLGSKTFVTVTVRNPVCALGRLLLVVVAERKGRVN